jgi:glutamate synthase (NADPH/NADH) small chain
MSAGNWKDALNLLTATNNMPEITGRVCPATCEYACVLGSNDDAVTIRENELAVIEYGFKNNLIKPRPPEKRTGKRAAVVGSGPAGLSCAAELNRAGHDVVVFERDKGPGGILRYGIPDFKLNKDILDRRIGIWKEEGIEFKTGVNVGEDYPVDKLVNDFDAVCIACGSRTPRDLDIEGRDLKGIYFAMDYLIQSNKRVAGESIPDDKQIDAQGKKVVVIGGGDTGADCVGTANRHGASCVIQIEVMPRPPECRSGDHPWPSYPLLLKTTSSHKEGGQRHWAVLTKKFIGKKGFVNRLSCVKVNFLNAGDKACPVIKEVPDSEFEIEADMAIIAIGFLHAEHSGLLKQLGLKLDKKGNIETGEDFKTSSEKIFSAGDARRGQSLIVWAIAEGRQCAYNMDKFLIGKSELHIIR